MTRREFRSLADPEAAAAAVESLGVSGGTEDVPLRDAHDRILAERIDADVDVPGFDRAAMDGYAVRARDTFGASEREPVTLQVRGSVHAGTAPDEAVIEGTAVDVATGAVLPQGADAVVPVECTVEGDDAVEIETAVAPGDHVMVRGADIASGDRTLGPGTRLGPRHVGLLAAVGTETVTVRARPRIAVVSTGAELVQPGQPLDSRAGQIYDVNSHSIASAVQAAGGDSVVYETTTDDRDALREVLSRVADDASLVLTSGSTSAGSGDLLYELLEAHGEKHVHGVAVKPGRPLLVGRIFGTPYVGLPGYPVSALMAFSHFVTPALQAESRTDTETLDATLETRVRYDGGRLRLLPVGLVEDGNGNLLAYSPAKGSGATTTLVETDGFVRMAPETSLLDTGSRVHVRRFDAADPIPSVLGVGDPDPTLFEILDEVPTPRYLRFGREDARRWFEDGIPDVLVTVDDGHGDDTTGSGEMDDDAPVVRWDRDWGLVVPTGNPDSVEGIETLREGLQFANLDTDLSLRESFDALLDDSDISPETVSGYHRALPGFESAVRSVETGAADVGLGLARSASGHGLECIRLGIQTVRLQVAQERTEKRGVERLLAVAEQRVG